MNINFLEKDNNWMNGSTTYWFQDLDGETFGVVHSSSDEPCVVDCDGCPVNLDDPINNYLRDLPDSVTNEMVAM